MHINAPAPFLLLPFLSLFFPYSFLLPYSLPSLHLRSVSVTSFLHPFFPFLRLYTLTVLSFIFTCYRYLSSRLLPLSGSLVLSPFSFFLQTFLYSFFHISSFLSLSPLLPILHSRPLRIITLSSNLPSFFSLFFSPLQALPLFLPALL